jgi:hypothetical protein
MIAHARQQGIGLAWVGFDGFYGSDPAFLRTLDDQGEVFVGDVRKDQRIYREDPLREGTKGPLRVDILHRRVWLWDGEEAQARRWHLIVRREIDAPTETKYSLSNAPADTPVPRLAFMQGQRYIQPVTA